MSKDSSQVREAFGVGQGDIGAGIVGPSEDLAQGRSWRELIQFSSDGSRHIRGSNYVQLATVEPRTNTPRCRLCVFRGFQDLPKDHPLSHFVGDMSCIMIMTTDDRSEKVRQVLEHPSRAAEMVWWFAHSNEQYRIRGELIFVGGNGKYEYDNDEHLASARKEQWEKLTDASRESFFRQEIPGDPVSSGVYEMPVGGRDKDGNILAPPDTFLLMLMKPEHVDYLRSTDFYRQVDEFSGSEWSSTCVNC
jgi:hypothetical protein